MAAKTPAEEAAIIARAGIAVVLGGQLEMVAPLSIARNRDWKRRLAERIGVAWLSIGDTADNWSELVASVAAMTEAHIDLLIAYDQAYDADGNPTQAGVLGDRAWIEEHASEREVWTGLKAVLDEAFPQIAELLRKVPPAVLLPSLLQLLGSSTSSPSPAGPTDPPKSSTKRSRTPSSPS